mmetsp:Transcript_36078/g.84270  ORF Transcript_36078/g.84270 Transcript_36078/m.84270 type:complete len:204 (-) Transcript_36078:80-691(-)
MAVTPVPVPTMAVPAMAATPTPMTAAAAMPMAGPSLVAYPAEDRRVVVAMHVPLPRYSEPPIKSDKRKQGWTSEEDDSILRLVQLEGQKWACVASRLEGRSDDAVRNRYIRLMRKQAALEGSGLADARGLKQGDMWTAQEDAVVLHATREYESMGGCYPSWKQIAKKVPGRSANAVRNRYLRCLGQKPISAFSSAASTSSAAG